MTIGSISRALIFAFFAAMTVAALAAALRSLDPVPEICVCEVRE